MYNFVYTLLIFAVTLIGGPAVSPDDDDFDPDYVLDPVNSQYPELQQQLNDICFGQRPTGRGSKRKRGPKPNNR